MITAIVFVKADVARIPEVAEAIAALDGVSEVYSVTGQIDLIAMVRVRTHDDVAEVIADKLNKVAGVLETEKILRWLESDGVRLVHVDGEWSCPVGGATKHLRVHDAVEQSRSAVAPFEDRRSLRPVRQPVR